MTLIDLTPELRIIHEPTRLRILGMLYRETDLGFTALRNELNLTAGNLASHASRLEEAGFVRSRDALMRGGFEKRYQITAQGLETFERYLATLEAFASEARSSGLQPVAPQPAAAVEPRATHGGRGRPALATLGFLGVGFLFMVGEGAQLYLSGASGSEFVGIGLAGGLVGILAGVERLVTRFLRGGT